MDPVSIIALSVSLLLVISKVISKIRKSQCIYVSGEGEKYEMNFDTLTKHIETIDDEKTKKALNDILKGLTVTKP